MTIKRENYITIQGWMVTDLKLKGNCLLVYAIIYGFSQGDSQRFTGSRQYLAEWTNSTKRGVEKALTTLVEAGLLDKDVSVENGVKYCSYRASKIRREGDEQSSEEENKVRQGSEQSSSGVANKVPQGSEQSSPGVANKVPQGSEQSSPNKLGNITSYIPSNNSNYISSNNKARSRFVKPIYEEICAYCAERGNRVDPEKFLSYYESNGWKVGRNPMKDWKAAIRNWERNSFNSGAPKTAASSRDAGFETSNPFLEMLKERREQHDV